MAITHQHEELHIAFLEQSIGELKRAETHLDMLPRKLLGETVWRLKDLTQIIHDLDARWRELRRQFEAEKKPFASRQPSKPLPR